LIVTTLVLGLPGFSPQFFLFGLLFFTKVVTLVILDLVRWVLHLRSCLDVRLFAAMPSPERYVEVEGGRGKKEATDRNDQNSQVSIQAIWSLRSRMTTNGHGVDGFLWLLHRLWGFILHKNIQH